MKKRILPLALVLLMVIALVPSSLAASRPDVTFDGFDSTFFATVITPHEYLGEVKVGNLYNNGAPYDVSFNVFVVDDSVDKFVEHIYTTKRGLDIRSTGDYFEYDYINYGGEVQIACDSSGASYSKGTKDDPFVLTFTLSDSNKGVPYMIQCDIHDVNIDSEESWLGAIRWNFIVFTKSQIAEFKQTGNLPPIIDTFGDDVSSLLDFTELKALLSGTTSTPTPAPTPAPAQTLTAAPNAAKVLLDGAEVAYDAYTIDQENYIKLRDVAYTLNGTRVQFDAALVNGAITLTSGAAYTPDGSEMKAKGTAAKMPVLNKMKIVLDGREVELTAYTIDGNNYFKLRELAQTFDFFVGWDGTITIDTSKNYVAP